MTGGLSLRNDLLGRPAPANRFPRELLAGALAERRAASRVLGGVVLTGNSMGFAVYYQDEGSWTWSDTLG